VRGTPSDGKKPPESVGVDSKTSVIRMTVEVLISNSGMMVIVI
jgi:hypothetical protein